MLLKIYESEKNIQKVYDDVNKYCKTEKVDEEHFRSLIEKPKCFIARNFCALHNKFFL